MRRNALTDRVVIHALSLALVALMHSVVFRTKKHNAHVHLDSLAIPKWSVNNKSLVLALKIRVVIMHVVAICPLGLSAVVHQVVWAIQ